MVFSTKFKSWLVDKVIMIYIYANWYTKIVHIKEKKSQSLYIKKEKRSEPEYFEKIKTLVKK